MFSSGAKAAFQIRTTHHLNMSAITASPSANPSGQSFSDSAVVLQAEAVVIEKLRKQIKEAGSNAPKEMIAAFAKRQGAFLTRKIEFEKRKRTMGELPNPAIEPESSTFVDTLESTEPTRIDATLPEGMPAASTDPEAPNRTEVDATPEDELVPMKKVSGIWPLVWVLVAVAISACVWYLIAD